MSGILGCAWHAFGLANVVTGQFPQREVGARCVAEKTGTIQGVTLYQKDGTGYSAGTGGTLLVTIRANDPVTNLPTDYVRAIASRETPLPIVNHFPRIDFDDPLPITEGEVIQIVSSAIDPDPIHNFISINNLNNSALIPQAGDPSGLVATLVKDANVPWRVLNNLTPIFCIHYADGTTQGQGYSDALSSSGLLTLDANVRVREAITISGGNKTVSSLRAFHKGRVNANITDANGAVIVGAVQCSKDTTTQTWGLYSLAATLLDGKTYYLNLYGSGAGQVYPIVKNQMPVTPSVFSGHMEQSADGGKTWTKQPNRDLMAYLAYV